MAPAGPSLKLLLRRLATAQPHCRAWYLSRRCSAPLGIAGLLAVVSAITTSVDSEIGEWVVDHRGDVAKFAAVAAVVYVILIAIAQVGRNLERWVRRVAETAGPISRSLGALVSITMLGPPLSWPLLRLLRYSRRSVYALTLLGGPLFGAVWVPAYGLGVWSLIEGLF